MSSQMHRNFFLLKFQAALSAMRLEQERQFRTLLRKSLVKVFLPFQTLLFRAKGFRWFLVTFLWLNGFHKVLVYFNALLMGFHKFVKVFFSLRASVRVR